MCVVWLSPIWCLPHLSEVVLLFHTPVSCPLSLLPGVRVPWMVGHGLSVQLFPLLHHGVSVPLCEHNHVRPKASHSFFTMRGTHFGQIHALLSNACTYVNNHISWKKGKLRCYAKSLTHCTGFISANTSCTGMTARWPSHANLGLVQTFSPVVLTPLVV